MKNVNQLLELMNQVKIDSMDDDLVIYRERLLRMKAEHCKGGLGHFRDADTIETKILAAL